MANQRFRLYRLYADGEFRGTVDATTLHAANVIRYEDPDGPDHRARLALSGLIMGEETPERRRAVERFALEVALNPTALTEAYPDGTLDVSAIPDNTLDFIIASNWNKIALTIFPELAESEG